MGLDPLFAKRKHESEQEIYLRLLERVAADSRVSQAMFAEQVGIAKGLANAYFNRCVNKGWIKLRQVPRQRFLYYLTPAGMSEKARLTVRFLTSSYQFYRVARADLVSTMSEARQRGHRRLGVLGDGELAEIAAITSAEADVKIVGFVGQSDVRTTINGLPVKSSWSELGKTDAAMLAIFANARIVHADMRRNHPGVEVYVPRQLAALVGD